MQIKSSMLGSCKAGFIIHRTMHGLVWRTFSALKIGLFWCLFPELRSNTRVFTETVRNVCACIISFITRYGGRINDKR